MRENDESWDLSPTEERDHERRVVWRSCGCVLLVVAVLVGGLVIGAFVVLQETVDEYGGGFGCFTLEDGGSLRFVDRPAPNLVSPLPANPSLVVTGAAIDEPTASIAVAAPDGTQSVIYRRKSAAIDPGGRYLIAYRTATEQVVFDLADSRVVAEISGDATDFLFTGPGRGMLFVGAPDCKFGGAMKVDFDERSSERFDVQGLESQVGPVAVVEDSVVVNRVVPGVSGQSLDGVLAIDLVSGRTTTVAHSGALVTTTTSPARLWVRARDETRVLDLDGHEVSRSSGVGYAVGLPDGSVAYTSDYLSDASAIRLARADGPTVVDPVVLTNRSSVTSLLAGAVPGTLIVGWIDDIANRGGYEVCDLATAECQVVFEAEYYPLLEEPLGLITTPAAAR